MTELSPAAQAIRDAAWQSGYEHESIAAAALRAAAVYSYCPVDRKRLAAIADELEAL